MKKSLFAIRFRKNHKPNPILVEKNRAGLSLMPLDLCLRRGVISEEMHRAAQWFIFLYKTRYGQKRLITRYSDSLRRKFRGEYDEEYQVQQNILYKEVMQHLQQIGSYQIILDVCVFDLFPTFLRQVTTGINHKQYKMFKEYNLLISGLNELVKFASQTAKQKFKYY